MSKGCLVYTRQHMWHSMEKTYWTMP
ncbi:unnamed protein product [Linum tenue]|uniref:Uncharacterized protein n=1 Tax=Linum tenue TaxID=586396 RepID=A0AAV0JEX2_9ROSI|nr:unnamed protein product [Linum tenue]